MSLMSLVLESVRWSLQRRFPDFLHPAISGEPEWVRVFYVAQLIFFAAATIAAGAQINGAIRSRNWKGLQVVGFALYLAWWLEVAWASGYLGGLMH